MIPVVTPDEMAAIDRDAPDPVEVLIARAAAEVVRVAIGLLGGTYGRRVVVVAGKGNNGNDGRVAAAGLRRRGVTVAEFDASNAPSTLPEADLVIDAAYGTGFRGSYTFPDPNGAPVLAVDVPSGVSGLTGEVSGSAPTAVTTVTFAALKPGLLLGEGPSRCGAVVVADIGLDTTRATTHLVEDTDVLAWVPARPVDSHKWRQAVWVVAGSPSMSGAASLCTAAALRSGAGYVRLSTPGADTIDAPIEAVRWPLPERAWADAISDGGVERFAAVVIGPGLGTSKHTRRDIRRAVEQVDRPLVLDGDGLSALGRRADERLAGRNAATVLTPHDGEFAGLTGSAPDADRVASALALARWCGAVVLLKGPTTVVADPAGSVLLVRTGDARLATAGTGDVLSGMIAAHLASGMAPPRAAAAAAHLHGLAARAGSARGLLASDLPDLIPAAWEALVGPRSS